MKEGIFPTITNEDYHRDNGISPSGIALMRESPAKYYNRYLSGKHKHEMTRSLLLGQALHTRTLEFHEFNNRFAVMPDNIKIKRGKAYDAFFDANIDKHILSIKEHDEIVAMSNAARQHPLYERIMLNAQIEHSLYWHDNGIQFRARPDLYNQEIIVDLKSTESADKDDFQRSILTYGYHRQAAMCLDGLTKLTGKQYKHFVFFCVENSEPWLTAMYVLDDDAIAIGRREYQQAGLRYHQCLSADVWPGHPEDLQLVSLPDWYLRTHQ